MPFENPSLFFVLKVNASLIMVVTCCDCYLSDYNEKRVETQESSNIRTQSVTKFIKIYVSFYTVSCVFFPNNMSNLFSFITG